MALFQKTFAAQIAVVMWNDSYLYSASMVDRGVKTTLFLLRIETFDCPDPVLF
jgi:hypothetical protein